MKVLSLGWGVQSFTIAAMVALGELEPVDFAIHADTTNEASWTYEFADRYTRWLFAKGLNILTVKPAENKMKSFDNYGGVYIPAFTTDGHGSKGQLKRQCTGDWKIAPMRREIQKLRNNEPVEMWLGISMDEIQRMKPADVKYITNRWPLIELGMSRMDCISWLIRNKLEIPGRSSCIFCPYHSRKEWTEIKKVKKDWSKAINYDHEIRKLRPPYDLFIHQDRIPLGLVDLRSDEEKGQLRLWDAECEGICDT